MTLAKRNARTAAPVRKGNLAVDERRDSTVPSDERREDSRPFIEASEAPPRIDQHLGSASLAQHVLARALRGRSRLDRRKT
jgi:hypothetical protein